MSALHTWKVWLLVSALGPLCFSSGFIPAPATSNRAIPTSHNECQPWRKPCFQIASSIITLSAAKSGKKRRRRRRKDQSSAETAQVPPVQREQVPVETERSSEDTIPPAPAQEVPQEDFSLIKDVASFEFETDGPGPIGETPQGSEGAIPLPDIKETLKRKEEEERARVEEEKLKEKRRIKRSDKEAFTKLLEQQPYADADDSFFEKEEYTTVSALLGEGSKPFLGIPTGPLQVGHFIGSLGIILMAFIQYPGFPLTNLPTPLRDCLQGGLAITYAVNLVLAVVAAFKAGERGQPALLWVAKTFSVGGLAYDQLMQLPTLDESKGTSRRA